MNNRKVLQAVLKRSIQVAIDFDLVGFGLLAIDGTKVMSAASPSATLSLANLRENLAEIDDRIEEILHETETAEPQDQGQETALPEKLQPAQERQKLIREKLERFQETEKNHVNTQDPNAQMMKCERRKDMAYNARVCTDDKAGIITEQMVSSAESPKEAGHASRRLIDRF